MSEADRVYLRTIISQEHTNRYPQITQSDYFEIFTAEQILKSYGVDADEIEFGRVGGSNDGGVDCIYFGNCSTRFLILQSILLTGAG